MSEFVSQKEKKFITPNPNPFPIDKIPELNLNPIDGFLSMPSYALEKTNRYILQQELMQTLYGSANLAFDKVTRQSVVVKISNKVAAHNQKTRAGTKVLDNIPREIAIHNHIQQMLTKDKCDYIGEFLDSFEDAFYYYNVYPFYAAGELFGFVNSLPQKYLPEQEVQTFGRQILNGLQWLHSHGIVHSDLSIENICVDRSLNAKIIDFAVASIHPKQKKNVEKFVSCTCFIPVESKTSSGNLFYCDKICKDSLKPGKLRYMSPELFNNNFWDAYANDIWSFGIVLFMIATGHVPFEIPAPGDEAYEFFISGMWLQNKTGTVYEHLSETLLNLLNSIFKPQHNRIKLNEILNHPFFADKSKK